MFETKNAKSKIHSTSPEGDRVAAMHAHFVARAESGQAMTLEGLCAEHPNEAAALREFHEERVEDLLVEYLGDHSLSDRAQFARFCSKRPAYAPELARMPERMLGLQEALGASPAAAEADRPGTFGRYRVLGSRGKGNMGEVFRVWDEQLRREMALKVMHTSIAWNHTEVEQANARFTEEAQVTAQLDHPGIVPVYELGTTGAGALFFTMKLVKGKSLLEILKAREDGEKTEDWSHPRVGRLVLKVAEALAYAHSKGVLHRDLKPANIMVGRYGAVYVMDWGLSRILDSLETHLPGVDGHMTRAVESVRSRPEDDRTAGAFRTQAGMPVGTPYYMSPEQAYGNATELSQSTDVYGLGATLYHLLAGIPPYGDTHREGWGGPLLMHLVSHSPTPLAQVAPNVPMALCEIVNRALARKPSERFANMAEMATALGDYLDSPTAILSEIAGANALRNESNGKGSSPGPIKVILFAASMFVLGLWVCQIFGK